MATMLANGNGSLQLTMAGGGELSALLVDLSGLQFGNALLSALGIPDRDRIECFVADFALLRGELQTRALLLDTTSDITTGGGVINLRTETLAYQIKTEAKHFHYRHAARADFHFLTRSNSRIPGRSLTSRSSLARWGGGRTGVAVPARGHLADYPVRCW